MRARPCSTGAVKRDLRGGGLLGCRPDRAVQVSAALRRWGATPAAACQASGAAFPSRPAILDDHGTFTFAQLQQRSAALSAVLAERGVGPGETIAVRAGNHHWLVETLIAAARLQANVLLLDPRASDSHLACIARPQRPLVAVLDRPPAAPGTGPVLLGATAGRPCGPADGLEELIAAAGAPPTPLPGESLAQIILSEPEPDGGWLHPRRPATLTPPAVRCAIPLRPRQTTMICAPLSSPWGHLHLTLAMRLTSTLVLSERFDPLDVLAALQEHTVSALALTPEMLAAIMSLPASTLSWYRTPALSVIALRDATVPGELAIPAMRRFGRVLYNRRGPAVITLHPAPAAGGLALAA